MRAHVALICSGSGCRLRIALLIICMFQLKIKLDKGLIKLGKVHAQLCYKLALTQVHQSDSFLSVAALL